MRTTAGHTTGSAAGARPTHGALGEEAPWGCCVAAGGIDTVVVPGFHKRTSVNATNHRGPRFAVRRERQGPKTVCVAVLAVALGLALLSGVAGCGDDGDPRVPAPPQSEGRHPAFVTDADGRSLLLRGLNVSSSAKDDPLRMPWVTQEDLVRLRQWGFNAVRFLVFWDAIEPQPGQYDREYLARVRERVDWCARAGLMVVLDMHQDVFGKFAFDGKPLGFNGAPAWAARTDGLPHQIVQPWALTYLQPGVRRAFDNFWKAEGPHADVQEHYVAMWREVAAYFHDHPGVIGYDLMNEPFAGSAAAGQWGPLRVGDPERSRMFEETLLTSFYQRLIDSIRTVDAEKWIFFEPLALPANNGGPSYVGKLTDPRRGRPRLVYAPHFYAFEPEVNNFFDPSVTPEMDSWHGQRRAELLSRGEPLVVGEFGLPWSAGGDPLGYLAKALTVFDDVASGWFYWSYDPGSWGPVTGDARTETPLLPVLVQPYARSVAGRPLRYRFDRETRRYEIEFVDDPALSVPTEVFVPASRVYPQGWRYRLDVPQKAVQVEWDSEAQILRVWLRHRGGLHRIVVEPDA